MMCHASVVQLQLPGCHHSYTKLQILHAPTHVEVDSRDCTVHPRVPPQDADVQEWFDEDFGLTKSRREAEVLRQQQLQIEQEIQELQAQQQDSVPYFYLREIPNKPPPPYTPPDKESPTRTRPVPVPTSEEEMTRHIRLYARDAYRALKHGDTAKPPTNDMFTRFLWDLAKELVLEACPEVVESDLPWDRVSPPVSTWRASLRPTSETAVVNGVLHRGLVLFGMLPRAQQETLIAKWSRKKRDQVDQLLVWDSQAEEVEWTRFDVEIQEVKNEIADNIWDLLLEDTALSLNESLKLKRKRREQFSS